MSRDAHPAMYAPYQRFHAEKPDHFVPEGWEDLGRGLCPCGEAVRWSDEVEAWVRDRTLRVLILTPDEVASVKDRLRRAGLNAAWDDVVQDPSSTIFARGGGQVPRQLDLQDEIAAFQAGTE